jgi:riboflavin synthase
MFTGIIRHVGTVAKIQRRAQSRALVIDVGSLAEGLRVGDSVSVDGVCLTATRVEGRHVSFDVGAETLRLTTLGDLNETGLVNVEPSLRVGDALGGHFVGGHVDGTGVIRQRLELPGEVRLEIEVSPALSDQMILKGSAAVDGISLTIASLARGAFEVSLIPHTLAATTLQHKGPGSRVNVECDMMGRWVRRILQQGAAPGGAAALSVDDLQTQGF